MKILKQYKTLLFGIATGLFFSSLFSFLFSAFFSYSQETNLFASILLIISLFIFYITANVRQKQEPSSNGKIIRWLQTPVFIATPLIASIILIQGDIRSWFLVLISALLAWMILK